MQAMVKTLDDSGRDVGKRITCLIVALFGFALCCTCIELRAQDLNVKVTLADEVAQAEWVVLADLVAAQSRRNARGNLIVTDYRFRNVQALAGVPPAQFVLSQGGGTLNGETHAISDAPEFVQGERYLLFVRPDRGEMFPPFVGGAQGVYHLAADGRAMSLGADRSVLSRDDLLAEVERLLAMRGAAPPQAAAMGRPAGSYPEKAYRPLALTPPVPVQARVPLGEERMSEASPPPPVEDGSSLQPLTTMALDRPDSAPAPAWNYTHRITPPAVINAFLHDWVWHPFEENQLAYWNQYGGDVFRVYATPTGDWAWNNNRFDLAGWPSDATMIAQFGTGWAPNTLGITYSRWFGNGPIVESDTALNPAYCWTLDDAYATDGTSACYGFRGTLLHEMGHSWGLQHPWETQIVAWDSVMNYSPDAYRLPQLFADDTSAVRTAFGGPAIHDASIALYTVSASSGVGAQAVYTPTQTQSLSLRHGDNLSASMPNQFKIENLGTDAVTSPNLEFYLTQNRQSWGAAYAYLGGGAGAASQPAGWTYTYWLPNLPIPATTPTGDYYFAALLRDSDANVGNDSAWAIQRWNNSPVKVHVDNVPTMLVPQLTWQSSQTGALGPSGIWRFNLPGQAGVTYDLSLCAADGGSATFDTTLTVRYLGTQVAFNDDSCGRQSSLRWTAPYSATFTVEVGSYQSASQGSFVLAYLREVVDSIFTDGFDPGSH